MTRPRLSMTAEELMARSRAMAGVDLVDEHVIEPLTLMVYSLNEEAEIDAEGARAYERKFLRLLTNRLWMKRDFLAHPEIAELPVNGPVIVMGVARSGTTKLQKVLAASGDFNFLTFWQNFCWASQTGVPGEPLEARIAEADDFCNWFDVRSPETKLGHHFLALEPEEEGPLSEGCFVTPSLIGYSEVPTYARWFAGQSRLVFFEFLRDVCKYLQWQGLADPAKPWLLKSPNYKGQELEILKVFPDTRFVIAHRSPLQTLPSMCKLVQCFRKAYGGTAPPNQAIVERNYMTMESHLAIRAAHPELPLIDVRFEDIVDALPQVIDRIYAHAGMELTAEARGRMIRWNTENQMHKLGEFKYSLEDAGLDPAVIRQRMAGYFELLDGLSPLSTQPAWGEPQRQAD